MNARQKAKYYKRRYDLLKQQPMPYMVERHKIDTLQFEQFFPARIIKQANEEYPREIIKRRLAQYLAENLDKYVDYRTIYNPRVDEYQFYGRLQVVVNLYNREV